MNHLTYEQLQNFVHGSCSGEHELHLRSCPACRAEAERLRTMDRALRSLPLAEPSPEFTGRVMRELGIGSSPSFAWLFFRNLAPFLAFTIVAALLIVALKVAGVFDTTDLGQTGAATQQVYTQVGGSVGSGLHAFNEWMATYFSFAFAKNTYGLTAFVFVFLGAIALLDKYLIMPFMRRQRAQFRD